MGRQGKGMRANKDRDIVLTPEQRRRISGMGDSATRTVCNFVEEVVKNEFVALQPMTNFSPKLQGEAEQLAASCAMIVERAISKVFEGEPPHTLSALEDRYSKSHIALMEALFTPTTTPLQSHIYYVIANSYRAYCDEITPQLLYVMPAEQSQMIH